MLTKSINGLTIVSLAMGLAEPAFAQSPAPSPTASWAPKISVRAEARMVDRTCMRTAVEKRDNAVIAALNTFHASVKKDLETRRDTLRAAWDISAKNERKTATI